jgi:hypothetical protein
MGVKCPPRQIRSRKERKIFNDYLEKYSNPTQAHFNELALIYRDRTDCKYIFPKLPSMLRVYYRRWTETRIIIAKEQAMKNGYNILLRQLATPSESTNTNIALLEKGELEELLEDANNPAYIANREQQTVAKLPAPPIVAPHQLEFVSFNGNTPMQRRSPRCFYWPYCKKMIVECGGRSDNCCNEVNSGRVACPDQDTLTEAKRKARNEEKKNRKRTCRALSS